MTTRCPHPICALQATHVGADVTPEAVAFGRAMDKYKRKSGRPYPTFAEVLGVAAALGYRKAAAPQPSPEAPP